jgi:hypothetical protein
VISAHANMVVEATGPGGAIVSFTLTAADLVNPLSPAVTCIPASGSLFPLGTTTVNCQAQDAAGNIGTRSFTITVQDNSGPVLTLPGNMTVPATSGLGAVVTFSASATDAVGPASPAVTCLPPSGSMFPLGTTTVNCSATDTAGNTSTGSFTITVVDMTAPVLALPANMTVEATGPAGATVNFTASASDWGGPASPAVTCLPASGSLFPLGTTTVNCSATDAAGNTATGSFTITVVDTTAPVVGILAPITAEATGPTGAIVNYFAPMAVDLVNPLSPAVTCLPASGSLFPMGTTTVTCSATDAAGNTGTSTSTITVGDTTAPVITLLGSDPVVAPLGGYYTDAGAIACDLVDGDLTAAIVTVNPVDTSIAGTYIITYDVTDSHATRPPR